MHNKEQLIDHIRQRPGMYVGHTDFTGVKSMLEYFLDEAIDDSHPQEIRLHLFDQNRVDISITGINTAALNARLQALPAKPGWEGLGLYVLPALCRHLRIWQDGPESEYMEANNGRIVHWPSAFDIHDDRLHLSFTVDPELFREVRVEYGHLNHFLRKFAYLNPSLRIITEDHILNQRNVLHYPGGLSDRLREVVARLPYANPKLFLDLCTTLNGYTYRMAFCYSNAVGHHPSIRSFTNHHETLLGGSLVNGILKGMADALKAVDAPESSRINRRMLRKGLLLFAVVKGKGFKYRGSTRWMLGMPKLEKDIRHYVYTEVSQHLKTHPEDVDAVVSQFRTEQDDWG